MIGALRRLARALFGDYEIYLIYTSPTLPAPERQALPPGFELGRLDEVALNEADPLIRDQRFYFGAEADVFGCWQGDRVIALCAYWHGERYRERNFWPLSEHEGKLVQIVTLPAARGRGVATALVKHSANVMAGKGFHRLYARVWHSNLASSRAFENAGWCRIATVFEFSAIGARRRLTFRMARPIQEKA